MAIVTETVSRRFINVVAGTPIAVDFPLFEAADAGVYYGNASVKAVLNVDYTVTTGEDFYTFSLTPLASLLVKISVLMANDPTEANAITVRREMDFLTDATAAAVRYTPFTSREFERTALRFQEMQEKLNRAIVFGPRFTADSQLAQIDVFTPGAVLAVNEDGTRLIASTPLQDVFLASQRAQQAAAEAEGYRDEVVSAKDAAVAAAEASGNVVFFDTKAAADAGLAALSNNQIIEVFADESKNGMRTRYRKQSGAYSLKVIFGDFDATAALVGAMIYAAVRQTIRTNGYAAAGDGGSALYKRVVSEPSHAGKLQSADGAWWENVEDIWTAEMFGAVGDGVTDDSVAVQNAASRVGQRVRVLPKTYVVGDIVPASGVHFQGYAGHSYTEIEAQIAGTYLLKVGASCMFNLNGKRSNSFINVALNGRNRTVPVLSGGSQRLYLLHCTIVRGSHNIGGAVGDGDSYTRTMQVTDCIISNGQVGVGSIIDSFFSGVHIASNWRNVVCSAGSNSNHWTNCRIEWAQGGAGAVPNNNIELYDCASWTFVGGMIDRGGGYALSLKLCKNMMFGSYMQRRASKDNGTGEYDAHFYIEACDDILFTGVGTETGVDDGGTGTLTPKYIARFGGSAANMGRISFVGCDLTGYTVAAFANASIVNDLAVRACKGVGDREATNLPRIVNGRVYIERKTTATMAAAGGSATLNMAKQSTNVNSRDTHELLVEVRGVSSGDSYAAKFTLMTQRNSGSATLLLGAAYGEVGVAGIIGPAGSRIQVALSNVAADGSTFDLVLTNIHADKTYAVVAELK